MPGSDPTDLTLEAAAEGIRSRRVSAEELVRACLARIERLEPALHAFITVTADEVISAARESDRAVAAGAARPLEGIPVAVKDLFDTRGMRTTAGSAILRDRVPGEDAVVVAKLRSAGAVIVGKTNLHEWAFGVTNQNPHFGGARNPWDATRIPGGSSGGSAIALAVGECAGALGSDTGGSIRIPASLCGVVGLKPTYGRVSVRGAIPLSWTLDHAGPMARTVRDVALLYRAIAGYDARDPASADVDVEDPLGTIDDGARGLRLGLPREGFFDAADEAVARLARAGVAALEREGAPVVEVVFPPLRDVLAAQRTIISVDAAAYHADHLARDTSRIGEDVLARLRSGEATSARDYALARRRRDEIRRAVISLFAQCDVLVTPTTAIAAPPADAPDAVATAARLTAMTSPFNLTGLPAVSVPCGLTSEGLPVGLQLVAAPWREATLLRAARAYEVVSGWDARRPAMAATA
ncbi:MAG: amidase [Chloroflexota bacterium]|nr:amidase [Chloroflexota bacterium]